MNNLRQKKGFVFLMTSALLILLFIITGCGSLKSKPPLSAEQAYQRIENEDVVLEFTFLDQDILTQRHGTKDNPFLPPPIVLTPYRFYVFNLTITAKQSISLSTGHFIMKIGSKNFRPSTRDSLKSLWKGIEEDYASKKYDTRKKEEAIRRYLIPETFILYPGEHISGYCVFAGQLPLTDSLRITVPVNSLAHEITEKLTVDFSF